MRECVIHDAMGQRIAKTVTNKNVTTGDKFVTTYYVRDPQGNVLAVYEHKHGDSDNGAFTLTEQHLYGASRLGMKKRDLALNATNASEPTPPVTHYELTNHLGNVLAVISDEASTAARAGGTNSSIKMMIKIKINKYAVMKKKIHIYIYSFVYDYEL